MLNETFINKCINYCLCCNDEYKIIRPMLLNIKYIVDWYSNEYKDKDKYPMEYSHKFDLLNLLLKERLESAKFSKEDFILGLQSGIYDDLTDFLKGCNAKLLEEDHDEFINLVNDKCKLCDLFKGHEELERFVNDISSGNFENINTLTSRWEKVIIRAHANIVESKKAESLKNIETLDLRNNKYSDVINKIREVYTKASDLSVCFPSLQKALRSGGLEDGRFYLIGGTTGVGKSLMLVNMISESIKQDVCMNEKPDVFLYITAENLVHETWERFYTILTGESGEVLKNRILKQEDKEIENKIKNILNSVNKNIIFEYVQANRTTVREIEVLIDNVKEKYNLRAVYIDYLDLIKSSTPNLDRRIELIDVANSFKLLATINNIPIVTVTQLNASGYNSESANLTQMGEARGKNFVADFVIFLQRESDREIERIGNDGSMESIIKIRVSLLKSRNGGLVSPFYIFMRTKVDKQDVFTGIMEELINNDIENDNSNRRGNDVIDENDCYTQDIHILSEDYQFSNNSF